MTPKSKRPMWTGRSVDNAGDVGQVPSGPAQPEGADADLARLRLFVAEEEQAQPQPGEPGGGARDADEVLEDETRLTPREAVLSLLEIIFMPAEMAGLHRTMQVWTPEVQGEFADKLLAVLKKYALGRRIIAFMQNGLGVEEIALIMFLGVMAKATAAAVRADVADIRAAAAKEAAGGTGD